MQQRQTIGIWKAEQKILFIKTSNFTVLLKGKSFISDNKQQMNLFILYIKQEMVYGFC